MEFIEVYRKVKGIVHKARRDYYIKSWEPSDWDQEGMMILYELIESEPSLVGRESDLYRYFKVKFRNHIHDKIRQQESQKRRFDRMPHEEIGSLSHMIEERGLSLDERYLFWERMQSYEKQLDTKGKESYQRFLRGERFLGRSHFCRSLREHMIDFQR